MPLHCAVFLFAEGDNGEGGTDTERGLRSGVISSIGRERTATEIEGCAIASGEKKESE